MQKFQAVFHRPKKFTGISQTTHYVKEAKPWPIKRHVEILLHDFLNNIIFQAADTHKSHFPRNKNLKIHLRHDFKWFFMILNYSLQTYLR